MLNSLNMLIAPVCVGVDCTPSGETARSRIRLQLSSRCFSLLESALRPEPDGEIVIPVQAVMFTQGVNEQQTLANKTSTEHGRHQV